MKRKRYTSLYLSESLFLILFFAAIITVQIIFYIRYIDGTDKVRSSTPGDLLPSGILLILIVFVVLYMLCRFVCFDDKGVYYKHLKKSYFIPWEDVRYVKITLNANDKVGFGSYIVIATDQYALQYTDFRASRENFIVLRYRISALDFIKKHYNGEIIRAGSIR